MCRLAVVHRFNPGPDVFYALAHASIISSKSRTVRAELFTPAAIVGQVHLVLCPIKKQDTELLFQLFDLARERGLCEVQHHSGLGEAKRFRHGDEVTQMTNLHRQWILGIIA